MLKYKLTKRGNKFFIKSIEKATILAIFTKVKLGESLTLYDKKKKEKKMKEKRSSRISKRNFVCHVFSLFCNIYMVI
jgi:hypothetical protein